MTVPERKDQPAFLPGFRKDAEEVSNGGTLVLLNPKEIDVEVIVGADSFEIAKNALEKVDQAADKHGFKPDSDVDDVVNNFKEVIETETISRKYKPKGL